MKFKVPAYLFFISMILVLFFIPEGYSKSLSEEEQLIWVGTGAFKDRLYDIAEKQFLNFTKTYPKHEKVFDVYYLLGKTFFLRGKFKEAKTAFLRIISEGKNYESMDHALFGLAEVEIRLGNLEEAYKSLQTLTKRFPKFDQIDFSYYLLGLLELRSNQLSAAESNLRQVPLFSKNTPLVQSSLFWLGALAFKQKQYDAAVHYFKMIWQTPQSIPTEYLKYTLFWLAETHIKIGRFSEAQTFYGTFHERFKKDPLATEAIWRMAFCEYQLGNIQKAIDLFQSFKNQFKDSPLLPFTHYLLGKMFLVNGDPLSSIKELNFILNASPGNIWGGASLLMLYWNYIQLGEKEGAHRTFQRLQKTASFEDEKIMMQWFNAEILFAEGEISESLPYYFNILNSAYREKALFQIGKGYFLENKYREAMTNLDILLLEFPASQYADPSLFIKGECLIKLGHLEKALELYHLVVQQKKNPLWQLFAYAQMGSLYSARKEYDQAEIAFKRIMEEFPHHPLYYHAALQLGNLNFNKNEIVEAISYYSMVLRGNILELLGQAHFGLGEVFFRQGKYDKALSNFETAIRYFKTTSAWFFLTHLEIGNLKRRGGHLDEAKKSYLIILDQSKDEEIKKATQALLNRIEPF